MPISIIDNFTVNTTKNIDSRLGPYDSVAQATGSISTLLRYVGMTITITGSGQPVEYWFNPTTADTDLVLKTASVTGFVTTSSFNAFTSSYNTGSFTGSFTGSLFGTSSWAVSASNAQTASYVLNAVSSSFASTASYATIAGNGGVTQLLAGSNITLGPTNGLGQVTISSTGGGGSSFNTATGSYGSFYSTSSQTNPVANIPRSMSLDHTDITNGVSISGSTNPYNTYIKTQNAGVYNIQFSAQVEKTDSGTDEIVIWLSKNGIDLTDTATTMTLVGNSTKVVAAWNWFVTSAANDYYQIIWISADTGMRLLAETISGTHPGIPSVIVTANRVDQFLSNTGSFSGSFTGAFSGSLFGTSSWATNAQTASFAPNYQLTSGTGSMLAPYVLTASTSSMTVLSASFASTASFAQGGNGSFSGSFSGSGANLNSIPTTAIVGNFTQIATGSVTASVTPTQFSVVSGSMTEFVITGTGVTLGSAITDIHRVTGSLLVTGSNTIIGNQTITGSLRVSSSNATQFLVGNQSLFVNSSGNVGIGTITPSDSLEISSSLTASLKITGTGGSLITISRQGFPSQAGFIRYPGNYQIGTVGSDPLQFLTNNAVRMQIQDSTGNVGIGTTSPTATLDVAGFTRITPTNAQLTARSSSLTLTGTSGATSGNAYIIANTTTFAPTTGNATYASFYDGSTINPTNGLSTISRGLYINPTIQSVAEYRAIEFTNNSGFGIYQSGSAKNSLNGDVLIGTNNTGSTAAGKLQIIGSSATTGNALVISNSTPINLLTVQNNGQIISNTPTVILAASQSAFIISQSISHSAVVGASVYGLNLVPTFFATTSSQTEIALRVAPTFLTSSAAATSGSNIIADFSSLGTGTQFTVNDTVSGSIYLVNDVSGLPIIEATSNWDVNIYDYPTKVLQKTGSQIIINGTLKATGSFILPLSQSTSPQIGSAYWSGSFLFVHNGTRYMSASFF